MTAFDTAMNRLFAHEGGYVNHPKDPGGETKYGISNRAYPSVNIRALTKDDAKAIYRRDYWKAVKGDELPPALAFQVFDAAVNHGTAWASRALQRVVGAEADGKIGPKTLQAVRSKPEADVIDLFNGYRELYYKSLPTFDTFGKGWLARLEENRRYATEDLA